METRVLLKGVGFKETEGGADIPGNGFFAVRDEGAGS